MRLGHRFWEIRKYLLDKISPSSIIPILESRANRFHDIQQKFIGYQFTQGFDYSKTIPPLLNIHMNDIGEPFQSGAYPLNNKEIEYAVMRYYAQLWNLKLRDLTIDEETDPTRFRSQDPDAYWGYVLSMGGSEGNLMSFWTARDYIEGKFLIINNQNKPIKVPSVRTKKGLSTSSSEICPASLPPVYFTSEASHYSVFKAAAIMNVCSFAEYGNGYYLHEEIPGIKEKGKEFPSSVPVKSDFDGRVDIDKLVELIRFFAKKGHGIIVNLNYGTTFMGAYDEIHNIVPQLKKIFQETGLDRIEMKVYDPERKEYYVSQRRGYWIHVDGSLGAAYLPYLKKYAEENLRTPENPDPVVDQVVEDGALKEYRLSDIPPLDFIQYPELSSTVVSGHKFPGTPWPCGVYMSKQQFQLYPQNAPVYIGCTDSTLSGSRSGLSPVALWSYLGSKPIKEISHDAYKCLHVAQQVEGKLREIASTKIERERLKIRRAPFSLSVAFNRVNDEIANKYSLAGQQIENLLYNHLYVMNNVANDQKALMEFYEDLKNDNAFSVEKPETKINMGHGHW